MSSLNQVITQYRSLRFCNIAEQLEQLVNQAEANELTHRRHGLFSGLQNDPVSAVIHG